MNPESKIHFFTRFRFNGMLLLEQILGPRLFGATLARTKAKLLLRLTASLNQGSPASKQFVERRQNLSGIDFHREFFDLSKPVIFSGAARDWECCRKWNLDYFSVAHGDNDLLIVESNGLTTRKQTSAHEFLTVRELVGNIKKGGDKYLRFSPLLHENPILAEALNMEWLQERRGGGTFGNTYYMFMGGKGQKTLLHADQPCNLYVQIYGEKKWTMFLPGDSACLYPEVTNTAYVKSPLDIESVDAEKFPLFKYAHAYEAHLMPGDVMYIPPHVWHQVENLTDTIAVGYRFSSLRAALKSSLTFTVLRILSTNPPIWKTREYGKIDTNLIWAHTAGKIKEVLAQREQRRNLKSAPVNEEARH
ncbi:MAG: cupin-like domain-containing protein [Bdellovibrionales bacterium]